MKLKALLGAMLALGLAGSAMADIIDFSGTGQDTGTISYAGGVAPLVGTNILIDGVKGIGTPANSGPVFPVTGGSLSFTTGNFVSYSAGQYTFGPGGTLTITGNGPGGSSGTLLSGNVVSGAYLAGTFKLALATGNDTKNTNLLTFFGEPMGLPWSFSSSLHTATAPPPPANPNSPDAFSLRTIGSNNIQNSVPDGGTTVMLLGGALVGIATLRRKFQV